MVKSRDAYTVLVGKPEGKRAVRIFMHIWNDNTKMDLQEVGWERKVWIDLAQAMDRWWTPVNVLMNLQVA
jgi:hypothetical protein